MSVCLLTGPIKNVLDCYSVCFLLLFSKKSTEIDTQRRILFACFAKSHYIKYMMKKEMDIMEKVEVKNLNAGKYVVLKLSES